MKSFELATCLEPAVPGGLSRAPYLRELISMFTIVIEDEWDTNQDPSPLPSDSVLESITTRDSASSKKLANAICAQLDIKAFIERLHELDLATQELIAHDEHIDLENFEYDVDTGSGAKFNHLVALDIAVLRSTPLPFLIHDSAIIKLIAFALVAELLAVYTNTANLTSRPGEPKQVFFSFDATRAYGTKAEKRVAPAQVIHLGEGAEALYGFTWNTETTDHHDPQPSEGAEAK